MLVFLDDVVVSCFFYIRWLVCVVVGRGWWCVVGVVCFNVNVVN